MRVVVVDDSLVVRRQVVNLLRERSGIEVVGEAGDLADGLRTVKETRPDFVVLDLNLPGGSGFRLVGDFKRQGLHPKVVVLTNYADDAFRQHAEYLGVYSFLDKSNEFERIADVIIGAKAPNRGQMDSSSV